MCGILFCVKPEDCDGKYKFVASDGNLISLRRRGPDADNQMKISISGRWQVTFAGFTLWLQGDSPTHQPLSDSSGNILLWNGDIFDGEIISKGIPNGLSDTQFLLEKLEIASTIDEVCNILESINGPWSLVYFKKNLNLVVTGRDKFGRHSLLWNCTNLEALSYPLVISSVYCQGEVGAFNEIPSSSLYQISFTDSLQIKAICQRKHYSLNRGLPSDGQLIDWGPEILSNPLSKSVMNLYMSVWQQEVDQLESLLLEAVKSRIHCQPLLCKQCVQMHGQTNNKCGHSKLAILFSGGLDSSILAALSDRAWPESESIDLLNVAFPLRTKNAALEKFDVPDRLTGLQALEELQKLNPSRKWNFLKINIELEELLEVRKSRIAALVRPASTVLDDSIGCAQWFAARGEGHLLGQIDEKYVSPARVVLMGAGADEQMAGYARHRQRFIKGGWSSLMSEVEMEMNRISERNLGRDNRIIADHGRAPRLPYLDEKVVDYLSRLPISAKVDLRLPTGLGDKIILRALAYRLGLIKTATEPKRAIQFGSRIAKAEARKEKGSHICDRLAANLSIDD